MKKKVTNYNLIQTIVLESNLSMDENTKTTIEKQILEKLSQKNHLNLNIFDMLKKFTLGLFSVLFLAVVAYGLTKYYFKPEAKKADFDKVEVTLDKSTGDASQSMKIAVDDHESVSSAQTVLSFQSYKPIEILDLKLSSVQTGRAFDGNKSDLLMLGFAKDNEEVLRISEMKYANASDYMAPENSEEVNLKINGENVKAYYVVYDTSAIDPNSELALGGDIRSASKSLSMLFDGLSIDIQAYSDSISKTDLTNIASSIVK